MWSEPQRLHPVAALVTAYKLLKELLIPLIIVLVSQGIHADSPMLGMLLAGGTFLAVVLIWGFLSWYRFTYRVTDNELNVQYGVLVHKKSFIPRERIQSIDFNQGVMQRIFGVVAVQVETAGGNKPEATLSALYWHQAEELRQELLGQRQLLTENDKLEHPVKKILIRRLLILGATSGGGLGLALSLFSGAWAILHRFDIDWENYLDWIGGRWDTLQFVVGVLFLLWLLALLGIVLKYGGFTLTRKGNRLQIVYGLLQQRQVSIPIHRIQAVRLVEGVLRQPLGYGVLQVESAGIGQQSGEKVILWPLIHKTEINDILKDFLPEFAQAVSLQSLPKKSRNRYVRRTLIPFIIVVIPLTILMYLFYGGIGLSALALLLLAVLWGLLLYRDAGWGQRDEMLAIRFRNWARTSVWIPKRCIQFMDVGQNPFQRRVNLVSFDVGLASRAYFGLVDISKEQGEELMEWYRPMAEPRELF